MIRGFELPASRCFRRREAVIISAWDRLRPGQMMAHLSMPSRRPEGRFEKPKKS